MIQVASVLVRDLRHAVLCLFFQHTDPSIQQAIAEQDKHQSLEITDESFEYKSRIDATGKRFSKIFGRVHARRNQKKEIDPEEMKLLSIGVDERMTVSTAGSMLQNLVSKATNAVINSGSDKRLQNSIQTLQAPQRRAIFVEIASASTMLFQPTQENQNDLRATVTEVNMHRARFDSLFRSETIANGIPDVNQNVMEQTAEAGPSPKFLLKRKAAWSGIDQTRVSEASNAVRGEHSQDEHEAEFNALKRAQVKDSDTSERLLRYQQQRYAFKTIVVKI